MRFIYEVYRASDETLLAEGETLHVVTDKNKKVRSMPESYREKLLADVQTDENSFPEDAPPS
jgi:acyl-CoA thioester hydrolase